MSVRTIALEDANSTTTKPGRHLKLLPNQSGRFFLFYKPKSIYFFYDLEFFTCTRIPCVENSGFPAEHAPFGPSGHKLDQSTGDLQQGVLLLQKTGKGVRALPQQQHAH